MSEQDTMTGKHVTWETNIPGLLRRHVKRLHIEWEDHPPFDIAEQRLKDITTAMRLGFERIEDCREQTIEALSGSQED